MRVIDRMAYLEGRGERLELPPLQVHVPDPALVLELGLMTGEGRCKINQPKVMTTWTLFVV